MNKEEEILNKINQQGVEINEIYKSVEKTRKYILFMSIATIITFVLPLIIALIFIPRIISQYTELLGAF